MVFVVLSSCTSASVFLIKQKPFFFFLILSPSNSGEMLHYHELEAMGHHLQKNENSCITFHSFDRRLPWALAVNKQSKLDLLDKHTSLLPEMPECFPST